MTFKIGDKVHYVSGGPERGYYGIVQEILGSEYKTKWYWPDGGSLWTINKAEYLTLAEPEEASIPVYAVGNKDPVCYVEGESDRPKIVADGGPQAYYDFPGDWETFNDFIEYKSLHQWKEHSFHLGNIGKAICRWGDKDGATKEYDAKKIIYSACRVLKNIIGVESLRHYLQKLLDDPQFKQKD